MSSSTNDDAVSHAGILQNMLDQGFTSSNCLSEGTDNSLSADATNIRQTICTKTNTICFSDDGGIKKDLVTAFRFHERSSVSKKHGRFGIGAKFMMICLTLLKSIVHVFTRPNDGDEIKQLTLDFPKAIKMDKLTLISHGIEGKYDSIWDKYAIDSKKKGTVIHLPSTKTIVQDIVSMIISDTVENNLLFNIGTTYYTALSGDITYQINIDDISYRVIPIDRLCWDSIKENDKMTVVFRVCHHPDDSSDIRAYYTDPASNKVGYRLKVNKGHINNFEEEEYPEHFIFLGTVHVELAYSSDWVTLLEEELLYCGIAVPENKTKRVAIRTKLGGTEIKRNGKVVKVLPIAKRGKGDKASYPFHEGLKVRVSFEAVHDEQIVDVNSKTMDNVFNTQINKSELNKDTINKSVWAGICQVRENYGNYLYRREFPLAPKSVKKTQENNDSDDSDTDDSDSEERIPSTVPVAAPKPAVAPTLVLAPKPVVAPKPAPAAASMPAVTVPPMISSGPAVTTDVTAPVPVSLPSPTAPSQEQVASVTQIHAHIRNTSKCPREIIQLLHTMYTTYGPRLPEILERADITTRPKLIDDYNALLRVEDLLKELSKK